MIWKNILHELIAFVPQPISLQLTELMKYNTQVQIENLSLKILK